MPNPKSIIVCGIPRGFLLGMKQELALVGKVTAFVSVDGKEMDIQDSQKIYSYSDDFDWGYKGSGASQFALAVCIHLYGVAVGKDVYIRFKNEYISKLPYKQIFEQTIKFKDGWCEMIQQRLDHNKLLKKISFDIAIYVKSGKTPIEIFEMYEGKPICDKVDIYKVAAEIYEIYHNNKQDS